MSTSLITSGRTRSKPPPQTRTILVNHNKVAIDGVAVPQAANLPNNRVTTSKYTLLNFLPKNLFEQFRRIANFYFLCIAVIQVTTNSPVSPVTSLAPLIFVVTTTALKQGYEDWLRHKGDRATNNRLVPVLVSNELVKVKSENIRVGDVVMVRDNEEIPCDLVLLSSNHANGKGTVTTANLDGETNLKVRESLSFTKQLQKPGDFRQLKGIIECENPNTDLYEFVGNMKIEEEVELKTYSLGPSNLLVRGSRLKNTEFVYGVAVYTGQETKMALNSRLTSNKFSSIERTVNKYLIIYLCILFVMSMTATVCRSIYRNHPVKGRPWYLQGLAGQEEGVTAAVIFQEFLSFFVIFNYVIPISLYVTLEMVKFFGSKTLVNDPKLIDKNLPEKPVCNSSDLNEELGQVEYLFSDKTGTLTENLMKFKACSINGTLYEEKDDKLVREVAGIEQPEEATITPDIEHFLLALALCNTIQVNKRDDINGKEAFEYTADSPDEKALVEACARFNVVLASASDKSCDIVVGSTTRTYKKLHTFEFDSTRKRMSVIIVDDKGAIFMICKGAESELLSLVKGKVNETSAHIDSYANAGLRTMVVAFKTISPKEYHAIEALISAAGDVIDNRKETVETNLVLLGATAVEDRLQEEVSETISDLKKAGIKVWVLTGDKLETARSVALSCQLLDQTLTELVLARQQNADSCGDCLNRFVAEIEDTERTPGRKYAFIADGRSLQISMKFYLDKFQLVCESCAVVICCRMSPIQKAEVVHMIKVSKSRPVTAAIGDGANDVSMIQEAHVGFGLMGKEGRQAVNSSDFAFSRFKFVRRILLVHGHLFYNRVSTLIHYFFYKNVIFVTPQFLFTFYSAFSAQTLYHGMLLMLYNMLFTASPILIYGIIERHIPVDLLNRQPELYKIIRQNRKMTFWEFTKWFLKGVFHGIVIFTFFTIIWGNSSPFANGQLGGLFVFGTMVYHGVTLTATLKLCLMTRFWSVYFTATVFISLFTVPVFLSIYTNFKWRILGDDLYGIYNPLLLSVSFWLSLMLVPIVALLPDIIDMVVSNSLGPGFFSRLWRKKAARHVSPEQPINRY